DGQRYQPNSKDGFNLSEKMKKLRTKRQAVPHPSKLLIVGVLLFLLLQRVILMFEAVSDQHEFGNKKRVNDWAKGNQGPNDIEWLSLDPLNELRRDAGNLLVVIFLHRLWKTRPGASR